MAGSSYDMVQFDRSQHVTPEHYTVSTCKTTQVQCCVGPHAAESHDYSLSLLGTKVTPVEWHLSVIVHEGSEL